MKTSEKLLALALEVENLCEDIGYDFNESFDHQFGEIRMEIEKLELQHSARARAMKVKIYCKKCGAWYDIDELEITIGSEFKENKENVS